MSLDIQKNRNVKKYSFQEQVLRVFWILGKLAFRLSPRFLFGYRRFILRLFGAKVGNQVNIYASATIYFPWNLKIGDFSAIGENALIYNLGPVEIGKNVTISHLAQICAGTHEYSDPTMPLIKPKIMIEDNVWVCTQAFIGPGVKVAEGSVIGACAVLTKDSEAYKVYAGNPAKLIKDRVINR
ncbi:LbetaH domain-containing protein [Algoriphagus boritolerans]|uniref:Putative colanic acid biosynthesis acetyltransferase WcaF n=1 Tax=Algoriphagus boritolerans DSM 17298 = JCM 18970 TaxID=1120964 RepID=A0A1H5SCK9_9BACT|nr:putative colanic acid biosynthesis acetyltransferase [Algoriphagus boritolerans]SEF48265.1 putative colanic acid biosynthesis acetyltransferase WcaF [Algoriphagus boritolerans DSM 17298 = JCM 18970]